MSNRALFQIVAGIVLGIAMGSAIIYGIVELADWIVENANEPYSHPIPNSRASCWTDGEATAVVPPAVAQVVRL